MATTWAWIAATALAAGMASAPAEAKPTQCRDARGNVVVTDLGCPVVAASAPAPAPAAPPCPLTADERRRAVRLEDQFLNRFPDEARHRAAQRADLQQIVARIRLTEGRLAELLRERKGIDDDAEFYKGKPLPAALQGRVDASDAKLRALADVFHGDEQDLAHVVARYECERAKFGGLWNGAAPGASACAGACAAAP